MKAEYGELQKSYGEIRLFPETIDDIWHLDHLIRPGDTVFATTFRAVDTASDKIRPEKAEKKPVRLGIHVEKVEFHDYANRLRVTGTIEQGIDSGAYHTLNIEPGYEISVIRHWSRRDFERIERAVKASVYDVLHILSIEDGEAEIFRVRQYGPEPVIAIAMGSGKGADSNNRVAFFEAVFEQLQVITGPLVVAGPGFIKDDFMKYFRARDSEKAARAVVVDTRRGGAGAIQEVIGLGTLEKLVGDLQLAREVNLMDEFLKRISKGEPVAYGRDDVANASGCGAVEQVLVADSLIHDPGTITLLEEAERHNAGVVVFSTNFEPGKKLKALGGIAAILRYRIG
ncbi:MAG TPA: mRNA surveillance protein pelota [Methanoregulaceae archaeon]|nr:mRNA surveillance protein pelota [Methanoregulaceae archaeon]